eukprot:11223_1
MTITKHLESISFSSLTLPDLLELPKGNKWRRKFQSMPLRPSTSDTSFISTIDIFQTTYIHPIILLAIKVFTFSIIYHLVEEKTSKSISGFNYSWFITFFEFSCAFLLAFAERVSIAYNQVTSSTSNIAINNSETQSLLTNDIEEDTNDIELNHLTTCNKLYISLVNIWIFCIRDLFCWSYLFLSFNLIFSRGLATIVLQYYDMDYPTYAICRNSKMVFVMFLSVVWLKKSYKLSDWILVVLISISVLCFRLASHDVWFSQANTMGVPLLLLSTFLSATDSSWKEKMMKTGVKGLQPSEIIFNTNLLGIVILFIYLTVFSTEFMDANMFLISNPWTILWMILRGISYSLWIHFSVVLISKSGALINQYVSASRKLFTVILSFIMFKKPFYFMHGIGFICFMLACVIKIVAAQTYNHKNDINIKELTEMNKSSDVEIDNENDEIINNNNINTVQSDNDSDIEERKYNGFKTNFVPNTNRGNMFVQ